MMLVALVAASSVCTQVEPAAKADPQSAQIYLSVGESEFSAGASDTALVAFREAARLDPANERARAMLEKLCAEVPLEAEADADPFDEGVKLLDDGEPEEA